MVIKGRVKITAFWILGHIIAEKRSEISPLVSVVAVSLIMTIMVYALPVSILAFKLTTILILVLFLGSAAGTRVMGKPV
ncbi:hypothetical protein P4S73_09920 [Paraglaciecola sp. Hal342]